MTDKELQALAKAWEKEQYEEDSLIGFERFSVIAEDVMEFVSRTHEIVSKEKIKGMYKEAEEQYRFFRDECYHKSNKDMYLSEMMALEEIFPQTLNADKQ